MSTLNLRTRAIVLALCAALAAQVRTADQHLTAAQYGAASQELGNPSNTLFLDQHITNEIKTLAARFEDVARRAALVTHCGPKFLTNSDNRYEEQ